MPLTLVIGGAGFIGIEVSRLLREAGGDVVILGRGTEPFGRNEATFSMLEIPTDDHAKKPGHKPDDCPFCKKRAANSPIAAVSFVGTDGKVIPVDAQKLLGLAEGQDIVVRGTAFFDPALGIPVIQITGDGLFVRPQP